MKETYHHHHRVCVCVYSCRTSEEPHIEPSRKEEAIGLAVKSSIVYEEIGDVKTSFAYTQNVLYGLSPAGVTHRLTSDPVPQVPTGVEPPEPHTGGETHNYELIQTAEYQSINNAYRVQQCSAYGVASSVDAPCDPHILHERIRLFNDPCHPDQEETKSLPGLEESHDLNDRPCDPDREESSGAATKSHNQNSDPDSRASSGVTSSSKESCSLEECPAYGVA